MRLSDEMLMAHADGELDLVARAEVEAAMARDPAVARAVERHHAMTAKLRMAYEDVLDEPLPPALALLAGDEEAADVIESGPAREGRFDSARWRLPAWSAIALSVLTGVLIGVLLVRGSASPYEETPGGLVARGELGDRLSSLLAASADDSNVAIGLSFRHRDGRYCRTFTFRHGTSVAGLACRGRDDWKIEVLADATTAPRDAQTAAPMPATVARAVDMAINGDPLDAKAEAAARDADWRSLAMVAE
jgi:hypothetical protein